MRSRVITFHEWVGRCFDHEVADPQWYWQSDAEALLGASELALQYVTRLFGSPVSVLANYSDAQVNQGLWYIVSNTCSHHMEALVEESVPIRTRVHCVQSVATLYSQLFMLRCSNVLSHGRHQNSEVSPMNAVCYMFWDLLPLVGAPHVATRRELDHTVLEVLSSTLELPSLACQEGALHGLGHWAEDYPVEVGAAISRFLSRVDVGPELREYAESAATGSVA